MRDAELTAGAQLRGTKSDAVVVLLSDAAASGV